jgi:hypothetical protein
MAGGPNSMTLARPGIVGWSAQGSAAITGASNLTSPTPGCASRSSVNTPQGHPPPGNCASSTANPEGMTACAALPNWCARHSWG